MVQILRVLEEAKQYLTQNKHDAASNKLDRARNYLKDNVTNMPTDVAMELSLLTYTLPTISQVLAMNQAQTGEAERIFLKRAEFYANIASEIQTNLNLGGKCVAVDYLQRRRLNT